MIGAIVVATEQGLGYLAKAFYDNGIIDKVMIHHHTSRKNHWEWYQGSVETNEDLFLSKLTHLIFFETPYDWKIIIRAREKGIKTILIPMYECTPYPFPYEPDKIWCPSGLDYKFYHGKDQSNLKLVQIPVDVKWQKRTKARVFVHNAGNGGLGGRNGTKELLEALKWVKSPIRLIIRSQVSIKQIDDPRVEYRIGTFDDIWFEGDVFIFPEKFNGLSLPIQEAFASGMLVMATNRFPNTDYLPHKPLIPIKGYHKESINVSFDCADIDPKDIAKCIDSWYDKDITEFSLLGLKYNQLNSWKNLKEKYKTLLSA
jgi:hypothetical protein